jgi:hypothetical protein
MQGRFQLYFNDDDHNLMLSPLAWPTQFRYNNYQFLVYVLIIMYSVKRKRRFLVYDL